MNSALRETEGFPAPAVQRIADEVFGDGVVVELVRGEPGAVQPRLLVWDGKRARFEQRFTHGQVAYAPFSLDATLTRAIRFPPGIAAYTSTRKLFDELSMVIARVTRLRDSVVQPLAFFVLATWLVDVLPVAPLLWVIAPPTVPCEPLLQMMSVLCRRALFVNELTTTALRSLPLHLRPTVVTEVAAISRSFLKALRASNRRGSYEAAGGGLRDLFCAKIVCAQQPLSDSSFSGLPLEIALSSELARVPRMAMTEIERVADEFQPKLLMYRLMNRGKVVAPSIDLNEFTAPVQELAQNLAMSIVGDAELQARIVPLLKQRDQEVRVDRTLSLECIVIEALLAACHDTPADSLSVSDLTKSVNSILIGRGDVHQISPERVGWQLRALGFHTDFITGGRKGLLLSEANRVKVHGLARQFEVRSFVVGSKNRRCPHCLGVPEEDNEG